MNTKHTPTPWCTITPRHSYPLIATDDGTAIAKTDCSISSSGWVKDTETAQANAQFIVQAVNHHEELVAALEPFAQMNGLAVPQYAGSIEFARAVLAKVKGQA